MSGSPTSPRVLLVAEGVTLAHVGRALRLASILHADNFDVQLACDARYARFVADVPYPVHWIKSLAPEVFLQTLGRGRPVFTEAVLRDHVAADLEQLASVRPDAVIGDFRLSLSVSARVADVPYANVTNAYWSPYARPRFVMPSLPFAHLLNVRLADELFKLARPAAFAAHVRAFNRVRRARGLPPFPPDVRHAYCDGDLTLYADSPALIPTYHRPPSHRYIGAVLWSAPVPRPPWWEEATGREAPIYVSLGSSGASALLTSMVDALATLGRPVVVATAGRLVEDRRWPDGVYAADFVSGEEISARASVVVCNGGSLTTQQAMLDGIPVVGVASNLDQHLNMGYVERAGAGIAMRADRVTAAQVRDAVSCALIDRVLIDGARAARAALATPRADVDFPAAMRALIATAA